jgi:hypothetical protein
MTLSIKMELANQILRVIRGEIPWSSLQNLGITGCKEPEGWNWTMPSFDSLVAPTVSDIMTGLLVLQPKRNELFEWASFLLAASSLITFESLTQSQHGDSLLNVLWDIAAGDYSEVELHKLIDAIQKENKP